MKCSSVREKLFDYMDGTLKGSDLQAIEDHLKRCSECRHELEKVRQLDARLQQEIPAYLESIEPSPAFLNRLNRLELEPTSNETSSIWNSFLSVFQEHRMAFGTGLAVLIMIAVGLAIPTITQDSDDDETQMVAEAPAELMATESIRDGAMAEGEAELSSAEEYGMNKGITMPSEAATPPPAPAYDQSTEGGGGGPSLTWDASEDEMPIPSDEPAYMSTQMPEPVPPPAPTSPPAPIAEIEDGPDHDSQGSAGGSTVVGSEPMENPATIIAIDDTDVIAIIVDYIKIWGN